MLASIKRFFVPDKPVPGVRVPYDIDKGVAHFLRVLPRCTAKVVVASPAYSDKHYRCEVIVEAVGLLPWAEDHAGAVWSSDKVEQAARKALPLWLREANVTDLQPTYLLPPFVAVLHIYAPEFVSNGMAEVWCNECGKVVADIEREKIDKPNGSRWYQGTSEWHCPAGHLLYREDHEFEIFRGPPK